MDAAPPQETKPGHPSMQHRSNVGVPAQCFPPVPLPPSVSLPPATMRAPRGAMRYGQWAASAWFQIQQISPAWCSQRSCPRCRPRNRPAGGAPRQRSPAGGTDGGERWVGAGGVNCSMDVSCITVHPPARRGGKGRGMQASKRTLALSRPLALVHTGGPARECHTCLAVLLRLLRRAHVWARATTVRHTPHCEGAFRRKGVRATFHDRLAVTALSSLADCFNHRI